MSEDSPRLLFDRTCHAQSHASRSASSSAKRAGSRGRDGARSARVIVRRQPAPRRRELSGAPRQTAAASPASGASGLPCARTLTTPSIPSRAAERARASRCRSRCLNGRAERSRGQRGSGWPRTCARPLASGRGARLRAAARSFSGPAGAWDLHRRVHGGARRAWHCLHRDHPARRPFAEDVRAACLRARRGLPRSRARRGGGRSHRPHSLPGLGLHAHPWPPGARETELF